MLRLFVSSAVVVGVLLASSLTGSAQTNNRRVRQVPSALLKQLKQGLLQTDVPPYEASVLLTSNRVHQEGMKHIRMHVFRGLNGAERVEMMSPDRMRGVVIVDDGVKRWHYHPKRKVVFVRRSPSQHSSAGINADHLGLLADNYSLESQGVEDVCGHSCQVINIRPSRGRRGNPSAKVWIHKLHPLPLKVEHYAPDGSLRKRRVYESLEFKESLSEELFEFDKPSGIKLIDRSQGKRLPSVNLVEVENRVGFHPLLPDWRPPGYQRVGVRVRKFKGRSAVVLIYTDGLGMISIFEHPVQNKPRVAAGGPRGQKERRRRSPRRQGPNIFGGKELVRADLVPASLERRRIEGLEVVFVSDISRSLLKKMADAFVIP